MKDDTDQMLDATTAMIPPLLSAMDALSHAGRHLHPPDLDAVIAGMEEYRDPVQTGREAFSTVHWPDHLKGFASCVNDAATFVLRSFDEMAGAVEAANPVMGAYRAIGFNTKAVEALYPVANMLPPVSRYYLNDRAREDEALLTRLAEADGNRDHVGVMHADNATHERGGFSMYVPEYYDEADAAVPLVVAMHGGSGHGRSFLWSWLRDARSSGAIVLSPTSQEGTWSLMGPDVDSDPLDHVVSYVLQHWNIDRKRVLLTGMSDGGTFTYVNGLRSGSPFTHLAPIASSFHPMLLEMAGDGRLNGLPVYIVHGMLDWMFPPDVARLARDTLTAAGAQVVYREIPDLSHTYPREENVAILDWLGG